MTALGDARTILVAAIVLLVLGAERLWELRINRKHVAWLKGQGARFAGADGFGLILTVQVLLFVALPVEVVFSPWARLDGWFWPLLALAVLAQVVRYWVIATLGNRWSIRVVTLPGTPRILGGPYRFLRHPNYVVVALESLILPTMFGAWLTLLLVFPLNLVALARRIRLEDDALSRATRTGAP